MKKTKNLVFIALSAAFIAICAWLTIPGPVPFTMQTMAVVTVAALPTFVSVTLPGASLEKE